MVALAAAEDLIAIPRSDFDLILPRELERGFNRLGAAAGEVDAAALKGGTGKVEEFGRIFFGNLSGELTGVGELKLPGLRRHCGGDLGNAVSNEVHCGGAREVEISLAVRIPDVSAFAADGGGKVLTKGAMERSGAGHESDYRATVRVVSKELLVFPLTSDSSSLRSSE